eukprot:jgi/Astpho2/1303/fgenesh1_pm.00024_%23_4_t
MYNYVVSAHTPTAVNKAVVGNFTGAGDINLIISKFRRIEVHTLTPEGLQGIVDVPINGRCAAMELYRPKGRDKDLLFLALEHKKVAVLEWDADRKELVTAANGDVLDKVGRPVDAGMVGIVDPGCRMIGLHMYDGLFKVIPMSADGHLQEAFNIRIDEQRVIDICFLHACALPTVAIIFRDNRDNRHVKTYEINVKDKEFQEGPWSQQNLDPSACMLIPVTGPRGGAVVVGESTICYFHDSQPMRACQIDSTLIRAFGRVDEDGSRYLLGDTRGQLYMLVLNHDGRQVVGLKLESLGRTSAASALAYLDSGVVFVGSQFGDSQLIRLHPQAPNPTEPTNFVEVLERWTNLGPIVDMAVVDLERQGQGQVVTCSGAAQDGSLRIVRNGIGMIEQASVELPGIKGIWSLRASSSDEYDKYLVLTFVGETRVLAISAEDELDEAEIPGFESNAQTLLCGNMAGDQLVQVTTGGVRLLSAASGASVQQWQPPAGLQINIAAASATQVILGLGSGHLVYLEVGPGSIQQAGHLQLQAELACLDITPLGEDPDRAQIAVAGTWDQQLRLYRLPSMEQLHQEALGGQVIPRSILLADFEGVQYLLCALGDGRLSSFTLTPKTGMLHDRKTLSLGTKPITLRAFRSSGTSHVFAASDRPTVIHSSNMKLLYSNVNEDEVNFMASFNSAAFPDSLAVAKEGGLMIGSIDEIQKLHIRSVYLEEQPRRLAHQETTHTLGVSVSTGADGRDALRLVDDQTFETLDRFTLDAYELTCSLTSLQFAEDPKWYYVMGTAYAHPDEDEPSKGRILVFEAQGGKLVTVCDREVKGAVYNVTGFRGKVLAGINSRLQLYGWGQGSDGSMELSAEAGYSGFVLCLYVAVRGDFITVGDVMKSIYLLLYNASEGVLELRAQDYASNWMSAVAILDDDTYLGAENGYNLFTVRKNSAAASDDDRRRLEEVGCFGLGEFVNRFRHGSLVMKVPDSEAAKIQTLLFGTINGVIGVIASLPAQQFKYLEKLEACLRQVVHGVGGLDHFEWRHFNNQRQKKPPRGFVDGDLIEQYLDLDRQTMQQVATMMGDTTVEDLSKTVEDMARLH